MKRFLFLSLIALFPACTAELSDTDNSDVSEEEIHGGRAAPKEIAAVGKLTSANGDLCTATLIRPWVILTAAHCSADFNYFHITSPRGVTEKLPLFQYAVEPTGADLRLISLKKQASFAQEMRALGPRPSIGAAGLMIGYGQHWTGWRTISGSKYIADAKVVSNGYYTEADGLNGSSVAYGDSGGPLLVNGRVVGVLWGPSAPDSVRAMYTTTANHQAWLDAQAASMDHPPY